MTNIAAWALQRLPLRVFGPSIAALAVASVWVTSQWSVWSMVAAMSLAGVLVVQFRLWDDLEDAGADRLTHPERLLPNVSATPFAVLLTALTGLSLAVAARRGAAAATLVALDLWMLLGYRTFRRRMPDAVWRYGALPAKYPAFVAITSLVIGGEIAGRLGAAAGAAYVGAGAYEWIHQDSGPRSRS